MAADFTESTAVAKALRDIADRVDRGEYAFPELGFRSDLAVRLPQGEVYIQQRATGYVTFTLRVIDWAKVGEDY